VDERAQAAFFPAPPNETRTVVECRRRIHPPAHL